MMNIKTGTVYEKNGYTIMIDWIKNGSIGVRKFKTKIGEYGNIHNFCGLFRKSIKAFLEDIKGCKQG